MKQWFYGLMALGLLQGVSAQVKAQPTYRFTTLDVPGSLFPERSSTGATGINAAGQIVGAYNFSLRGSLAIAICWIRAATA